MKPQRAVPLYKSTCGALVFFAALVFTGAPLHAQTRDQFNCTGAGVADNVPQPGCTLTPGTPAPESTEVAPEEPSSNNGNDPFNQWRLEGQWNGQVCKALGDWSATAPGYIHVEFIRGTTQQAVPTVGGPPVGSPIPNVIANFSLYDAHGKFIAKASVSTAGNIFIANATKSLPLTLDYQGSGSGTRVWVYSAANNGDATGPTVEAFSLASNDGVHIFGGRARSDPRAGNSRELAYAEFTGVHDNRSLDAYRAQYPNPCGAAGGRPAPVTAKAGGPRPQPAANSNQPTPQALYQTAMDLVAKATWNGSAVVAAPGTYAAVHSVYRAQPNGLYARKLRKATSNFDWSHDNTAPGYRATASGPANGAGQQPLTVGPVIASEERNGEWTIQGSTTPGAQVDLDGKAAAEVKPDGSFRGKLPPYSPGAHVLTITARNAQGATATTYVRITPR